MPESALKHLEADVKAALENVNVPSYVIDRVGVVRWLNGAARRMVGDQTGRQFTSVVAPEETRRARDLFARKLVGNVEVTEGTFSVVDTAGNHLSVDISSVPLRRGEHVIGVFGQVSDVAQEPQPHPELPLTPRQAEVLRMLERGQSTAQIAEELYLSRETVRNHIRRLLQAVGASSRLEAVAVARGDRAVTI
jgi:PAS domain S-box-containing protein